MKTGFNISVAGFGVGINGSSQPQDEVSVIESILSFLKKKNKKVLVTIDEAMPNDNMRHFARNLEYLIQASLDTERLMKKGVIYTPERGVVELALPRFAEVIALY